MEAGGSPQALHLRQPEGGHEERGERFRVVVVPRGAGAARPRRQALGARSGDRGEAAAAGRGMDRHDGAQARRRAVQPVPAGYLLTSAIPFRIGLD